MLHGLVDRDVDSFVILLICNVILKILVDMAGEIAGEQRRQAGSRGTGKF